MKRKLSTLALSTALTFASPMASAQAGGLPAALDGVQAALRALTATINQLATQVSQLMTTLTTPPLLTPNVRLYAGPLPSNGYTSNCSATNISGSTISISLVLFDETGGVASNVIFNTVIPQQTVKISVLSLPGSGSCRFAVSDTKTIAATMSTTSGGLLIGAVPAAPAR